MRTENLASGAGQRMGRGGGVGGAGGRAYVRCKWTIAVASHGDRWRARVEQRTRFQTHAARK